jgi:hypothetical protein
MGLDNILKGAWDLHVHSDPDVIKRKVTDNEMMKRLAQRRMKGYAIKSHISMSTGRARLMNELYPDVTAVGSITLNNAVGGINPYAVELAVRDGAKIVWLPTMDSVNESSHIARTIASNAGKLPFFAKFKIEMEQEGRLIEPISILNDGILNDKMMDILDIVVQNNIALATGHISVEETFVLAKECNRRGFKKLIITHPNFPSTTFTKEQQKELADMGAYMEHCFTTPYTNKITWERVYDEIHYVGSNRCLLSTDLGQPTYVYPDEGMHMFAANLIENGFDQAEVRYMICDVPEFLING